MSFTALLQFCALAGDEQPAAATISAPAMHFFPFIALPPL
jgi:hypothetical protein